MQVKICGITRVEDAVCAVESGATMLGFVFAPSPRRIEPQKAAEILAELVKRSLRNRITAVGVFVNETPARVAEICNMATIDSAQIHGDETADECNHLTVPWYRALRVDEWFTSGSFRESVKELLCSAILIDAKVDGLYGGSGKRVSLEVAHMCKDAIRAEKKDFYLAGGVTPENVRMIIDELSPDGIDLSSSLEISPGIKSHDRIRALFDALNK
ncbi:MAG TPA: phosphoribosylanthranilate isomerase [Spirochaetota bacterium]